MLYKAANGITYKLEKGVIAIYPKGNCTHHLPGGSFNYPSVKIMERAIIKGENPYITVHSFKGLNKLQDMKVK